MDELLLHHHPQWAEEALFSAALQSFGIPGVLDHTSVLIAHPNIEGRIITKELALSTPYLPWGLQLPPCPNCSTNMWVTCKGGNGPKSEKAIAVWCALCKCQGMAAKPPQAQVIPSRCTPSPGCSILFLEHTDECLNVDWAEMSSTGKKAGGHVNQKA